MLGTAAWFNFNLNPSVILKKRISHSKTPCKVTSLNFAVHLNAVSVQPRTFHVVRTAILLLILCCWSLWIDVIVWIADKEIQPLAFVLRQKFTTYLFLWLIHCKPCALYTHCESLRIERPLGSANFRYNFNERYKVFRQITNMCNVLCPVDH